MNIKFETRVDGHFMEVMKRFDKALFEALAPPLVPFKIVQFTGSQTGDLVHLQLGGWFNIEWISKITDHGSNETEAYFIDEGTKLPFPLTSWRHRHIVSKIDDHHSMIIDDIQYRAGNKLITRMMYPLLYAGFKNRGKIYQQYFHKIAQTGYPDMRKTEL